MLLPWINIAPNTVQLGSIVPGYLGFQHGRSRKHGYLRSNCSRNSWPTSNKVTECQCLNTRTMGFGFGRRGFIGLRIRPAFLEWCVVDGGCWRFVASSRDRPLSALQGVEREHSRKK